jgi:hypothetical protein
MMMMCIPKVLTSSFPSPLLLSTSHFLHICHNPGQCKTKSPGVVLLSVRETTPHHPTPHHTGDDYNSGSYRQPRKLTFGMQLYSNPTRRNIEEDLNIFENGRRPQLF